MTSAQETRFKTVVRILYLWKTFDPKNLRSSNVQQTAETNGLHLQGGSVPAPQPGHGGHLHRDPGSLQHQIRGQGH